MNASIDNEPDALALPSAEREITRRVSTYAYPLNGATYPSRLVTRSKAESGQSSVIFGLHLHNRHCMADRMHVGWTYRP